MKMAVEKKKERNHGHIESTLPEELGLLRTGAVEIGTVLALSSNVSQVIRPINGHVACR